MIIKRISEMNQMEKYPLNEKGLKMCYADWYYDELPNQREETFKIYEEGVQIAELEMLFYTDKAFAILTKMHLLAKEKTKKAILKEFISYLFTTLQLPYPILEIKCEQAGSHLDYEELELCGFLSLTSDNTHYTILNPNFIELISNEKEKSLKNFIDIYWKFHKIHEEKMREWNIALRTIYDLVIESEKMPSNIIEPKLKEMQLLADKIKEHSLFVKEDPTYLQNYVFPTNSR